MKLQPASKKEIKRISVGSAICFVIMVAVFFVLSCLGVGTFGYTVILGGLAGTLVAIGNFTLLCLTIQRAAEIEDKKQMKARIQVSYNARLFLQAAWIVVAFLLPCFHVIAAAIPLLFPTVVIYVLQIKGKLVEPSQRKNPPLESEEEEERLDSFEA